MKGLAFAPHFPLQEGISFTAVVNNVELLVMCIFATLLKMRLCKVRPDLAVSRDLNLSVLLVSAMSLVGTGYLLLR